MIVDLGGAWARTRPLLPQRADWSSVHLGRDLSAGLMVALVALPLALGFGVSSGLGAEAGLVTAIVAGAAAAIFGGSRVQVSGPTGAMTVVLVPIIATHGADGVLVVGLLAGLILVGLGYAGAGRWIRYVPVPVVEGFTLGIAAIIALQQLPAILGVNAHADKVLTLAGRSISAWAESPHWAPLLVATAVVLAILALAKVLPAWPGALLVVAAATVSDHVLSLHLAVIGHVPSGLPAPHLPDIPVSDLDSLLLPAIAVAALAALESLLSASVADAMSVGRRHLATRRAHPRRCPALHRPGGCPLGG